MSCTIDEYGYCTDKRLVVPLKDSEREVHLSINTALADVLVIWLPPGAHVPKCRRAGSDAPVYCIDLGNPGVFNVEVQELEGTRPQSKVTIRPFLNDGAKAALAQRARIDPNVMADDIVAGERTNLQFSIDKWTVNFDLVIGPPEKAVRQVQLSSSAFENEGEEIAARCEQLNARERRNIAEAWSNMKNRAAEEVASELAYSVLESHHCRSAHWTAFRDQLWVQADSTCEIGNHKFIVFRIRNRAGGGDIFRVGEVAVVLDANKDPKRIEANAVFRRDDDDRRLGPEEVELGKDDEIIGSVHFLSSEAQGDVVLRLVEAGGSGREIELKGIGF